MPSRRSRMNNASKRRSKRNSDSPAASEKTTPIIRPGRKAGATLNDDRSDPRVAAVVRTVIAYPRPIALAALIAFRIVNALCIKTFFQPDEYFQSLEPAWGIAFGPSSGAWITWEWKERLRSSIHPYMFAAVYWAADWVCALLHLSPVIRAEALLVAPKMLGAIIAALMDYYTWIFAIKHAEPALNMPMITLLLMIFSPWQWFFGPRMLINSLEGTLTAAALFHWPWGLFVGLDARVTQQRGSLTKSLIFAAFACVLRAPNVMIWIVVAACSAINVIISRGPSAWRVLGLLIGSAVLYGSAVLGVSNVFDRVYYGELTVPALQFLRFNLVQNLAVFYGNNRGDYYITEGLPLLLTTALPPAMYGIYLSLTKPHNQYESLRDRTMVCAIVGTILALSWIPHKEVRFLQPLLLPLTWFAAKGWAPMVRRQLSTSQKQRKMLLPIAVAVVNMAIGFYVSQYHQRGVVDVVHYLRDEHIKASASNLISVGFLMPCHSTPWSSHLIGAQTRSWALTCEPPLHMTIEQRASYLDEADVFYADPQTWLSANMAPVPSTNGKGGGHEGKRGWPSHLVFFEALEPTLKEYLAGTRYRECWRGFNSHFHDDHRRQGDVVVWCTH